jgi:hypothetical protein
MVVSRGMKLAATMVTFVSLSALAACDPGYSFTTHNPCDTSIRVTLLDSDEFDRTTAEKSRFAATLPPHSDITWSTLDGHINPPFGVFLVNGPRSGEIIKSQTPEVTIPESACSSK